MKYLLIMNAYLKIFGCAAAALLLGACGGHQPAAERIRTVRTDTVRPFARPETVRFPGRVYAAREVEPAFKVSGTLQRLPLPEGATFRRGDLLAQLDDRDYALQLQAVEAEYNRIKGEAERVIALYGEGAATADAYDKARYGLQQIEAKRDNARNQLADTRLVAPFDGQVQRRFYEPPMVIGAGMPVLSIVSSEAPEVEINIPAADYARRDRFESFTADFDCVGQSDVALRLIGISPKANANQLYTVRFSLPATLNPRPAPGMNTMVSVISRAEGERRVSVAASALFADGDGGSCVWVCDDGCRVTARAVKVERLTVDGRAIVTEGLSAGERIVTAGARLLREGERVRPMEPASRTNVGGLL